jgi:hypothetical protein
MKVLRTLVQVLFLGGVVALLLRGLAGHTPNTCEYYCPFGGLVALYPLARYKSYACGWARFKSGWASWGGRCSAGASGCPRARTAYS